MVHENRFFFFFLGGGGGDKIWWIEKLIPIKQVEELIEKSAS
jgi:hypothetical protein